MIDEKWHETSIETAYERMSVFASRYIKVHVPINVKWAFYFRTLNNWLNGRNPITNNKLEPLESWKHDTMSRGGNSRSYYSTNGYEQNKY